MLKKGRKREARSVAVVYFLIGLVVLLGILTLIYFALVELDYSDQLKDPDATMRAYVEASATPEPTEEPASTEEAEDIDLTGLDLTTETIAELLDVDKDLWKQDLEGVETFYGKFEGHIPAELVREKDALAERLK